MKKDMSAQVKALLEKDPRFSLLLLSFHAVAHEGGVEAETYESALLRRAWKPALILAPTVEGVRAVLAAQKPARKIEMKRGVS